MFMPSSWRVVPVRFWPVSRGTKPKQLVRIVGDTTMIQATVARLQPAIPPEHLDYYHCGIGGRNPQTIANVEAEHVIAEPVVATLQPVCVLRRWL